MSPALAELPKTLRSYSTTTGASVCLPSGRSTQPAIAPHEFWLFFSSSAREAIAHGLADAAAGRLTEAESFAEFADIELDD